MSTPKVKRATAPRKLAHASAIKLEPARTEGFKRGALLAVDMLAELEGDDAMGACSLEPEWHKGNPQRDVVAKYLSQLTDSEVGVGFSAVLSHALAELMNGEVPSVEYLRCLATSPSREAQARWKRIGRRQ